MVASSSNNDRFSIGVKEPGIGWAQERSASFDTFVKEQDHEFHTTMEPHDLDEEDQRKPEHPFFQKDRRGMLQELLTASKARRLAILDQVDKANLDNQLVAYRSLVDDMDKIPSAEPVTVTIAGSPDAEKWALRDILIMSKSETCRAQHSLSAATSCLMKMSYYENSGNVTGMVGQLTVYFMRDQDIRVLARQYSEDIELYHTIDKEVQEDFEGNYDEAREWAEALLGMQESGSTEELDFITSSDMVDADGDPFTEACVGWASSAIHREIESFMTRYSAKQVEDRGIQAFFPSKEALFEAIKLYTAESRTPLIKKMELRLKSDIFKTGLQIVYLPGESKGVYAPIHVLTNRTRFAISRHCTRPGR